MLDLGWTELLLIGIVALIVVGPKDLPVMFRTLGKFTGKLRGMARDFSRAMEEAADEAGVKDVAKDLRKMTSPKSMGVDALKKAADFDDLDPFGEAESSTGSATTAPKTPELSEERAEAARKIRESTAAKATARLEAEAAAREAAKAAPAETSAPAPAASEQPADTPKA